MARERGVLVDRNIISTNGEAIRTFIDCDDEYLAMSTELAGVEAARGAA